MCKWLCTILQGSCPSHLASQFCGIQTGELAASLPFVYPTSFSINQRKRSCSTWVELENALQNERDSFLQLEAFVGRGQEEEESLDFPEVTQTTYLNGKSRSLKNRRSQESLKKALDELNLSDTRRDFVTLASLLRLCGNAKALSDGKHIHRLISESGLEQSTYLGNLLLQMYGNCGALEDARVWFAKMDKHDNFSWNFMTTAYARHKLCDEALQLSDQMFIQGMMTDEYIFTSIFSACASQVALEEGRRMHARIFGSKLESSTVVENALVNMYGKCSCLKEAKIIFDKMSEKSVISWTAMIAAYSQNGHGEEAISLYTQMLQEVMIPNKATVLSILDACANQTALTKGKQVHGCITGSTLVSDGMVSTALVNMYGKCGKVNSARRIFEKLTDQNVVVWTAMISSYTQNGYHKEAFQLFEQMQWERVIPNQVTFISILDACAGKKALGEGKQIHTCMTCNGFESDIIVATAIVHMYGKCSSLGDARMVFDRMPNSNVVSWNAMIAAYAQNGHSKEALELFNQMQEKGRNPGKVTLIIILSACANHEALVEGREMHTYVIRCGLHIDVVLGNALVNMYGKCGKLDLALWVLETMPDRNVITWTTVISAYAQHGHGKEALQLLDRMKREGVSPNKVTFVSILSACSHGGLVDEGRECLDCMKRIHGMTPTKEHYDCIVDLLGRAGRLDEAEDFISKMPTQPSLVSWMTLLGACRSFADMDRGERAAEHVFEMYPKCSAPYIILSNMYALAGRDSDAENILIQMQDKGFMQQQGSCYIEVNGRVHEFLADGQPHPQAEDIHSELRRLYWHAKDAGYASTLYPGLKALADKQKENNMCSHTEKLAIAFGSINTPPWATLFVAKSCQMCIECHLFMKVISKTTHRKIIVRDASQFHHINDGICSCADCW